VRRRKTIDPHALTDNEVTMVADLLDLARAWCDEQSLGVTGPELAVIEAFEREAIRLRNTGRGTVPK
jgi:hypothetical protein